MRRAVDKVAVCDYFSNPLPVRELVTDTVLMKNIDMPRVVDATARALVLGSQ